MYNKLNGNDSGKGSLWNVIICFMNGTGKVIGYALSYLIKF
jgi:hypothetical protein